MMHDNDYYDNLPYRPWIMTKNMLAYWQSDQQEWWVINGAWGGTSEHMENTYGADIVHATEFHCFILNNEDVNDYQAMMEKSHAMIDCYDDAIEPPKNTVGKSLKDFL